MPSVPFFDVWCEGYRATGEHGTASFLGRFPGATFRDAVITAMHQQEWEQRDGLFNEERLSYWGCKFYDNETDARRRYG